MWLTQMHRWVYVLRSYDAHVISIKDCNRDNTWDRNYTPNIMSLYRSMLLGECACSCTTLSLMDDMIFSGLDIHIHMKTIK